MSCRLKLACVTLVAGCATPAPAPDDSTIATSYLTDRAFRRAELVAELVDPSNGYSQVRLASYAVTGGWDDFPEANPRVEPVLGGDASAPLSSSAAALAIDIDPDDDAALLALGEQAFFHYPAQMFSPVGIAVQTGAPDFGLWRDPVRGLGGIHRVERDDGSIGLAFTCSSCHASIRDGELVAGVANEHIQVGSMMVASGVVPATDTAAFAAWGPGRVDVTTNDGREVVRIPDLRAEAHLGFLQADATVRHADMISLAIRIETLIITSNVVPERPPRIVALALARYLSSLAESLPPIPDASARGATVFASSCASCHAPPALTGAPVPLDVIGTDPAYGLSSQRGTGAYQVPSLHGVGARGLLFHDGAVDSLDKLLDPARVTAGYTGGVRPGPVPGHTFGLDLDDADRADLLAYLRAL
jgi:hypothetical protein